MRGLIVMMLLLVWGITHSQVNLVPNGSFEDTIQCPTLQAQISYATGWFQPTANTPDYFNTCYSGSSSTPVGVPGNFEGYQSPRTGNGYAGVASFSPSANGREYASSMLSIPLIAQKKYYVSFYVSLSDSSTYAIDRFGLYLSDTVIISGGYSTINVSPQIESPVDSVIMDKMGWKLIADTFYALGGEKYITIGTFRDDTALVIDTLPGTWYNAYYYIDDVSVIDCGYVGISNQNPDLDISITPNPGNGEFILRCNFPSALRIIFYDLLGEEISEFEIPPGEPSISLSLPFANGVYFYQLASDKNLLTTGKLVIQK